MNYFRRFIRGLLDNRLMRKNFFVLTMFTKLHNTIIIQDRRVVMLDYTVIGIVKPLDMLGILHRYDRLIYAI